MKKCAKEKMVRKTLYLKEKIVVKIEKKAKQDKRSFNFTAVDLLESATGE